MVKIMDQEAVMASIAVVAVAVSMEDNLEEVEGMVRMMEVEEQEVAVEMAAEEAVVVLMEDNSEEEVEVTVRITELEEQAAAGLAMELTLVAVAVVETLNIMDQEAQVVAMVPPAVMV